MAKKAKPPEPAGESAPMWIVSFADLVTLMMSFFVVLYALKQGGKESEVSVTEAIVNQFQGDIPLDPNDPVSVLHYKKRFNIDITKNAGTAELTSKGAEGTHAEVQTIRENALTATSGGSILFDAGKADLDEPARAAVAKLVPILQGHNAVLMVKGHVSSDETVNRPDDPYGTSLSTRRAMVVVEELVKLGIDRRVLRPVACGPYEPLKSGAYDPEELRRHRRVEVFSTDTFITDFHPIQTTPAEPGKEPAGKADARKDGEPAQKPHETPGPPPASHTEHGEPHKEH